MKKIIQISILTLAFTSSIFAQTTVYNDKHQEIDFTSEEIDLDLSESGVKPGGFQMAAALLAAIPTVIDVGFKITNNILEKKVKKFSGEYSKSNSYLAAGSGSVPAIEFKRSIAIGESGMTTALAIKFVPKNAEGVKMERYVYYYISELDLQYSVAKSTEKFPRMDYVIELKLDYVVDNQKKVLELAPITISSVSYGMNNLQMDKYRTDLIPIPENSLITGASIKIVETNPGKVRAEKILSIWNDHKDSAKTIINNFVPKDDEKETNASADGTSVTIDDAGGTASSNNSAPNNKEKNKLVNTKTGN